MSRSAPPPRRFIDCISSPWTLLPVAAGWTLLLAAWVLDGDLPLVLFLGAAGMLVGLGSALTQWLFAPGVDPELARRRRELFASLAADGPARTWALTEPAEA
jgi:hypothetical protein